MENKLFNIAEAKQIELVNLYLDRDHAGIKRHAQAFKKSQGNL